MMEIIVLLHCLNQCLDQTTTRQLERIISAVLAMSFGTLPPSGQFTQLNRLSLNHRLAKILSL